MKAIEARALTDEKAKRTPEQKLDDVRDAYLKCIFQDIRYSASNGLETAFVEKPHWNSKLTPDQQFDESKDMNHRVAKALKGLGYAVKDQDGYPRMWVISW